MSFVPLHTYCLPLNVTGQHTEINKNGANVNNTFVKSKKRRMHLRDKRAPKPPYSGN